MSKLLQIFPSDSPKTYFQVAYQPKEKLTKTNAATEMEKLGMPGKMENLAKGNFEQYTYESLRTHLQQNFFKQNISYAFDDPDDLFYVLLFQEAGRDYEDKDPALARRFYEKALEITRKYESVNRDDLKTSETMVYDARQEVLKKLK